MGPRPCGVQLYTLADSTGLGLTVSVRYKGGYETIVRYIRGGGGRAAAVTALLVLARTAATRWRLAQAGGTVGGGAVREPADWVDRGEEGSRATRGAEDGDVEVLAPAL